jgi:hypothetical protein
VVAVAGLVVTFVADHFVRPVLIGGATRLPFLWANGIIAASAVKAPSSTGCGTPAK